MGEAVLKTHSSQNPQRPRFTSSERETETGKVILGRISMFNIEVCPLNTPCEGSQAKTSSLPGRSSDLTFFIIACRRPGKEFTSPSPTPQARNLNEPVPERGSVLQRVTVHLRCGTSRHSSPCVTRASLCLSFLVCQVERIQRVLFAWGCCEKLIHTLSQTLPPGT